MFLWSKAGQTACQQLFQFDASSPVAVQRFDIASPGFNLLALGHQKLKNSQLHRVVLQEGFVDNLLLQGKQDGAIMQCGSPRTDQVLTRDPDAGTNLDPQRQ